MPQQAGETLRVNGCRHGHQREVAAEFLDFREHAHEQVGFESTLVDLIQDHRLRSLKSRISQEAPQENAGSDELHHSVRTRFALAADCITHPAAQTAAVERGKAAGG